MPWKTSSVMEEKLRFVFEHELRERTMTELCERYEITRPDRVCVVTALPRGGSSRAGGAQPRHAPAQQPDAGGARADGAGVAAGAHALGAAQAQAHSGARRAGAQLADRQHHRGVAEA